jgi:hypothetical protein
MKSIFNWIKNNPNRFMFLIPILLVAGISISHVVTWYDMANPINWAIYLSIAIEIGAMTALVAATNKIKGGVWFMFGIVTFIQMIGNIFYSYKEIDETGELFKSWIELTGPIWEMLGTESTDTIGLKRYLAYLEGGLLPIISLTSLHFFVKYDKKEDKETEKEKYFNYRNKHIEKIVSEREEKEYNPMTEHPQDIYYPPIKNEKTEIPLSVPEGKEFNVAYPLTDEIMSEISEMKSTDDIEEIMDNQIKKYIPDTEMEDEEDIPEPPKEVKTTEEIINKQTIKQPIKPTKTNIKRID